MGKTKAGTKTNRGQMHKTCLKCGRFRPDTTVHFYKGHALLGLGSTCKACIRPKQVIALASGETPGHSVKECANCWRELPATREYFSPFGKGALRLHPWCRECWRKETDWVYQFWKS